MVTWQDLVNAYEDGKQWIAGHTPSDLGADQHISNEAVIPQQETQQVSEQKYTSPQSDYYSLPVDMQTSTNDYIPQQEGNNEPTPDLVQELVSKVEEKLQPVSDIAQNAISDVEKKVGQWYQGAQQGLSEAQRANEANNQINPFTTNDYLGLTAPQQETPEQHQAKEWASNANANFINETVKPVAYAAGLVMPEVAVPFMVNDIGHDIAQNGVIQGVQDFVNYDKLASYWNNPDEFKSDFYNQPVTTATELLPAALLGHGTYKGIKSALRVNPDLASELVGKVEDALNNERGGVGKPEETPLVTSADMVRSVEEKLNEQKAKEQAAATNSPESFQSKLEKNHITNGFVSQDILPYVQDANTTAESLRNFLSPASVNDHTRAVADTIRDYNASHKLDYLQAEKGLVNARNYFDKMPIEQQKQSLIDYQEGNLTDPVLKPIVDSMKDVTSSTWQRLVDMGKNKEFEEWFLPQAWKNTPKNVAILRKWRENVMNSPSGWLNKKVVPSYREGMEMGLEPLHSNPVDAILHRESQAGRWLMGEKIKQELVGTGELKFVKPGEPIPESEGVKWQAVQGKDNPFGPNAKGTYFARPEVKTIIDNFLNKGWEDKSWYNRYMQTANTLNQFQLLGGFHFGFTSFDAVVSKLTLAPQLTADAIKNISKGKYKEAAGNIADALTKVPGPTTPFTTAWSGRKFIQDLTSKDKINDPLVQAYRAGGGQIGLAKDFTTKYQTSLRKAWVTGNYVGAAIRAPFAGAEFLSGLILEKVVPYQKAGVFKQLMGYELKRDPDLINNRKELRSVAAKVIDTIDNRLGQVNWDNLFLKPEFKQSLFMAMRAPGWTGGTIREIGGGVLDTAKIVSRVKDGGPVITHRMAYDIALPIAAIASNYTMQWLMTGKQPELTKEMPSLIFKFKNGQTDQWGNPKYSSMPSYLKDVYEWGEAPIDTAISKQHPFLSMLFQIGRNKDYFGTQIYDKNGSLADKALGVGKYAAQQFEPFSIRNAIKAMEDSSNKTMTGNDLAQVILPQIGINQTPSRLTMTDAQKAAREIVSNKIQTGPRTQEQSDKSQLKAQLRKDAVGQNKLPESFVAAISNGQISREEARKIWDERNKSPLQREVGNNMSLDEAMEIWQKSTDEEREKIRPEIIKKISNITHSSKASKEQKEKALEYFHNYIKQ